MFTGLVEDVGRIVSVTRSGSAGRLEVESLLPVEEIRMGDSIAVNGVCLTVVAKSAKHLVFDVSPETLDRTTLGHVRGGARANLERALRLGDRFGGHIVSGHVDCVAEITERRETSGNVLLTFRVPETISRYIIVKGSVAVDGISLTVNTVSSRSFSVNIIPHTSAQTTLQYLKTGEEVNIETDIIGKYVERLLGPTAGKPESAITMKLLAENGFL